MRTSAAFRVSSHCFLFLAAAAISPLFLSRLWLPFAAAVLILVCDLVAVGIENRFKRLAVAALPALVLPFSNSIYSAILLAAPVIYSAAVMASGRFSLEIWRLRREAVLVLLICLPVLLVAQLAGFELLFGEEYPKEPTYSCWALLFGAVVLLFLSLRAARAGAERSLEWQKQNLIWFFIPIAAAVPIGLFFGYGFIPVMKFIGIVVSAPVFAIIWLGNILFSEVFDEDIVDWESPASSERPLTEIDEDIHAVGGQGGVYEYFHKATHTQISKEALIIIGLSMLAALLITVTVLVILKSRRVKGEYLNDGAMEAPDEEFKRRKKSRRRRRAEADSADRVRLTYRQYLNFLRQHGIVPDKSSTTSDISNEARAVLRETDELLRGLYRKARYGRGEEITEAEADLALETYLKLVNDKNLKSEEER